VLLEKADDLGRRLSPVFLTKSGLALFDVNTVRCVAFFLACARWLCRAWALVDWSLIVFCVGCSGQTGFRTSGCLAEVGSCQLEYTYLGKMSGNVTHYRNVRFHLSRPRAAKLDADQAL